MPASAMLFGARRASAGQHDVAPRRSLRKTALIIVVALLALALGGGVAASTRGPVAGERIDVTGSKEIAELPDYGANGSVVVRYLHERSVTVRFSLQNPGLAPLTLEAINPFPTTLGLLNVERLMVNGQQLPIRLAGRERAEVVVHARFDHCAYFTEKAIDPYVGAQVTWSGLGLTRTTTAIYSDTILVRSPTMLDCPGRVMDRSAKQRSIDATITGRG